MCKRGLWLRIVMWQKLCCFSRPTLSLPTDHHHHHGCSNCKNSFFYDECVLLVFQKNLHRQRFLKSCHRVWTNCTLIHGKLPLEMGIGNWLCRALTKTAVTKTWLATASLEYKLIGLERNPAISVRRFWRDGGKWVLPRLFSSTFICI